jgi:hypothetical protein
VGTLGFPVTDASALLHAEDVRNNLAAWSVSSTFNYETSTLAASALSTLGGYQSTVGSVEASPNVGLTTENKSKINALAVRLYNTGSVTLRRTGSADLRATGVAQDARTSDALGALTGSLAGGSPLRIESPSGGLAWVEVGFGKYDTSAEKNPLTNFAQGTLPDSPGPDGKYLVPGSSEYAVDVFTPRFDKEGPVDIGIYLESDLEKPVVIIENAFDYKISAGPCFIATAAYGTPLAAQIGVLREFRDAYLLANPFGAAFVDLYYQAGPTLADIVARHPALAAVVRLVLWPVVQMARVSLVAPHPLALAGLFIAALLVRRTVRRRQISGMGRRVS